VSVANARLRELLGERDAEIAALRSLLAELDELRKQGAELQAQVADLAARLRQNSSRPPSQDGPGKAAPKSLRTKTGRKPGRPEGSRARRCS
jgi:transposase